MCCAGQMLPVMPHWLNDVHGLLTDGMLPMSRMQSSESPRTAPPMHCRLPFAAHAAVHDWLTVAFTQ